MRLYARGVSYSDEYFFVDPDPLLDAALRAWRVTGDSNEVLSLLQHQDENSEYPDYVVEVYPSFEEAESAVHDVLVKTVRGLTFVDFGFTTFGIASGGSTRWYSTEDDDDTWSSLLDATVPTKSSEADITRLLAWCDRHSWPHPSEKDHAAAVEVAERALEQHLSEVIDEQPEAFLADIVADQLHAAGREDLLIDLWATFVVPLVYVGPASTSEPATFDLRRMSFFKEHNIDTSRFSAESLDPSASTTALQPRDPAPTNDPPRKGLFGRIFGK
jgi:hypothetical protein